MGSEAQSLLTYCVTWLIFVDTEIRPEKQNKTEIERQRERIRERERGEKRETEREKGRD